MLGWAEAREDDRDPAANRLRAVENSLGRDEEPLFGHGRVYIGGLPRDYGRAVEEYLYCGTLCG